MPILFNINIDPLPAAINVSPEAMKRSIKMSINKPEYNDELDCEVTVFEGAHNTCDQTEESSPQHRTAEKATASKEEPIKDNYNI